MAAPNLIQITSVYGKTTGTAIGTPVTILVSNPTSSNKNYKVNTLYISNIDNTQPVRISVDFFRGGTSIRLIDRMIITSGDTLIAISRDTGVYLEEGDSIRCYADQNGLVHAMLSYEING
jgi:hypothetical protein